MPLFPETKGHTLVLSPITVCSIGSVLELLGIMPEKGGCVVHY